MPGTLSELPRDPTPVREALALLGVDSLVLAVHQASFPASPDDLGHGAPSSIGGLAFVDFAARLGFTGVLLGPAGITSAANPSPYDAGLFARNPLALSLAELATPAWGRALDPALLDAAVAARPAGDRVHHRYAHAAVDGLLRAFHAAVRRDPGAVPGLAERRSDFARRSPWLAHDARYEGVAAALGHDDQARWPDDPPCDADAADRFALAQLVAEDQHDALRRRARAAGLALYADAQIGIGHRDRWRRGGIFLPGYAMGAPPSRTNPGGQPWSYPVLDPRQMGDGGAALRFVDARVDLLLDHHDGLRLDHPHGWVCPWVYRTDAGDPGVAVRAGARLHESPDLPDHPALAGFARVRPGQIDRSLPRHDDAWVRALEPAQVDAYDAVVGRVLERARLRGVGPDRLVVEVLSTCPRPLAEVLARHGLGRFRVTQKSRVTVADDVYRADNARPPDWVMAGNHDTAPLRLAVDRWQGTPEAAHRAAHLAGRLARTDGERAALAERLARDPDAMCEAMLAELFVGPARHVMVFWVDLFGGREVYNTPGFFTDETWTLRVPRDFGGALAAALASGAPSLGGAIALALRARGLDEGEAGRALVARLRGTAPEGSRGG
jgi:4-alpha-glucanotransferase